MLKKIAITEIRLGMYVDEICGKWIDHPFWRRSFKISQPKQIQILQSSGIKEIWIDTNKGLDVEGSPPPPPVREEPEPAAATPEAAPPEAPKIAPLVALHEEVERARKVHTKAKAAVKYMFHDIRMGNALQPSETHHLVEDITQSLVRNSNAFLSLSRYKEADHHTYLHSLAVCALMIAVGRQFGLNEDELRNLGLAGLLHDIGLIHIPEWVLHKPGSLTPEEYEVIKTHPQIGWMNLLKDTPDMNEMVLDVCLHHHERVDGTGYPDGLKGEELSLFTKICTVCDVYDTLTSDCCYRKASSPAEAVRIMTKSQPGHFDLDVFHAFVRTVGIYPVGSVVKLNSGRVGIVTDQTAKSLLTPKVKMLFSTKTNLPISADIVDLSKSKDFIVSIEEPNKYGLNTKAIMGV